MLICQQCRAELIDGQVICTRCSYDLRQSVVRAEMTKGTSALVILIGVLLVPAVPGAFFVACITSSMLTASRFRRVETIELDFFCGFLAAALVLAAGGFLMHWLINYRRHPSEWTELPPLPPAEPDSLPTSRDSV